MNNINKKPIPHRVYNPSKEHPYVTGAVDIIDDVKNKHQQKINAETDSSLANHQQQLNNKYNKNEVYRKDETYSQGEVDEIASAFTSQKYVTVEATDQTTAADIPALINASGRGEQADTIYRVGSWDCKEEEYNPAVYSEYAWSDINNAYHPLDVKEYTLATADDFIEPDAEQRAKIVSVGAAADVYGSYVDNPEYVEIKIDTEEKIIEATKIDGTKTFPAGVETSSVSVGGGTASSVNSTEFIDLKLDSEGHILEGTTKDGTKVIGGNLEIVGDAIIGGITYYVVSSPEWLKAIVDHDNRIICGIKVDGTFCVTDIDFLTSNNMKEIFNFFGVEGNSEFLSVELDDQEKILGGRKSDGTKFENVGLELNGTIFKGINDFERRIEIKIDNRGNIISCRKGDGTLVENVGIETSTISAQSLNLSEEGSIELAQKIADSINVSDSAVPEYFFENDYLPNKIAKFEQIRQNSGALTDGFIFISDTHVGFHKSHGSLNSIPLIEYIIKNSSINKVIHGGDVEGIWTDDINKVIADATAGNLWSSAARKYGGDYLGCRGNHDFPVDIYTRNPDGTWNHQNYGGIKAPAVWNYFMNQISNNSHKVIFNAEDTEKDQIYYYYDNELSKIRYVCVDSMCTMPSGETSANIFKKAQSDWIYNAIIETPSGYGIVFFTHVPPLDVNYNASMVEYNNLTKFIQAAINKTSVSMNDTTYDFNDAPEILLTLAGHIHTDSALFALRGTWVMTASDCWINDSRYFFYYNSQYRPFAEYGTITDACIDMMCLDRENKELNCVRVGVGGDRIVHLEQLSLNVGESLQLQTKLSGTVQWVISNSIGQSYTQEAGQPYVWTQNADYASISDGFVTSIAAGESTVAAIDENGNFEFWGIKSV